MTSPSAHMFIEVPVDPIARPQPVTFPVMQPTAPADPHFRTITTTNRREDAPAGLAPQFADQRDAEAQRGENYGDSSGRLWMMYLTEADKEDKDITESWKGDTDGILVFTGLFSSTVATFIVANYPNLSADSSDTTNALLAQISQQLANISSGTPIPSIATQSQPFQPTSSAVRVNVMWFLSLVLSLTCALFATLMQQWARRYLRLAQRRGAPHHRARMRAYIFAGVEAFAMNLAIETIPPLLHISVFLFLAGLVDFLLPINTTVAYFTLGCVTLFALAYVILTILPIVLLHCPYGTPLSGIMWSLSQISLLGIFLAIRGIEGRFHGLLLTVWGWAHQQVTGSLAPTKWREMLDNRVEKHSRWFSDGLGKSVELSATAAPPTVDARALEWTLTVLDEDKEIEDFAARVPGFFDSLVVPDATSAILPLMSDQPTTEPILGARLSDLLKTCTPGTSPLTEEKRKRRLQVCLKSLWYCGRAYEQQRELEPLPSYVRVAFASPEMTRRFQTEQDLSARVIGRCFGALVAKKLSADISLRRVQVNDGVLACLSAILGIESREVMSLLGQPGAIEFASIISLLLVDAHLLGDDTMPSDVLDVFKQTLYILSQTLLTGGHANPSLRQVAQFNEIYSKAPNWLKYELAEVSDKLPPISSYAQAGIVTFPEPEHAQESWTDISHVSLQSRENQVRVGGAPDSGIGGGVH